MAVFFALAHARVASQIAFGTQGGTVIRIDVEERAGNAMPDCARLAV